MIAVSPIYVDETTLTVVAPASISSSGPVDMIFTDATGCAAICFGCYTYN